MARLIHWQGNEQEVFPSDPKFGFCGWEIWKHLGLSEQGEDIDQEVDLPSGEIMFIIESGSLRDRTGERLNPAATMLLQQATGNSGDFVSGNALVCSFRETLREEDFRYWTNQE